jgi:SAM-dependent methyltransferase
MNDAEERGGTPSLTEEARRLLEVIRTAAVGGNEQQFRGQVEAHLREVAAALGLEMIHEKEVTLGSSGRADTIYNRFIVEWEKPGSFRPANSSPKNLASIKQVQSYTEGLFWKTRQRPGRIAGCCTDGRYLIFVTKPEAAWVIADPVPVSEASCLRFLEYFHSLHSGTALIPEYLSEDFSAQNARTQRTVRELYHSLELHADAPALDAIYQQWAAFYSAATDYKQWHEKLANEAQLRAMVKAFGLKPETLDLNRFFFALHTYFAVLTKLLAYLVVGRYTDLPTPDLQDWRKQSNEVLVARFKELERGGPFRAAGIRNFLEGDFFSWYTSFVTPELASALRAIVERLADYDPTTLDLAPAPTQDLLKKLYHRLVPPMVRKALGEYYTPDWLAQRLLNMLDGGTYRGRPDTRLLDPACGSGTFLMLAIKAVRENSAAQTMDQGDLLRRICHNVVGIDLNPLAVTAARTNYLLALGPLLKHRGETELDIPVYLADSVMTPSRGGNLLNADVVEVLLSIGKVALPNRLATQHGVESLTRLLDDHLLKEPSSDPETFLASVKDELTSEGADWKNDSEIIRDLYITLLDLHSQGRNGMWARILKNAFAPVFLAPFDLVAGNPPWINWQNLPEGYRTETKDLWVKHGLFVHSGMDTILGKGKKDISTLMTYVAADAYLKDGGRLGFVITQSVFKTSAAGQGFRRFVTRKGIPLQCSFVDDFGDMQLFEGATNRTAVFILRKGRATRFPVPYTYWRKKEGGRVGGFGYDSPLQDVIDKTIRRQFVASGVNAADPTSAWLTGPRKAVDAVQKVLGNSDYQAHAGTYSGGANALYWFEILRDHGDGTVTARNITEGAKRKVDSAQVRLEKDLLYPLLRGRDVSAWRAEPSAHLLLVQDVAKRRGIDEKTMEREYPLAMRWLTLNKPTLLQRAAYKRYFRADRDPYWSMFNIGDYTMSPWKVVWSEVAHELNAAVVGHSDGRPVLPDHTVIAVAVGNEDESHFVAGVLNSSLFRFGVARYIVLHPDPHILGSFRVPAYEPGDPAHKAISAEAKRLAGGTQDSVAAIHPQLDTLCARLWDVDAEGLTAVQQAYTEFHIRTPKPPTGEDKE